MKIRQARTPCESQPRLGVNKRNLRRRRANPSPASTRCCARRSVCRGTRRIVSRRSARERERRATEERLHREAASSVDCALERRAPSSNSSNALDRMRCLTDNRRIASYGMWDAAGALSFHRTTPKINQTLVTLLPPPAIPWQITGNHWVALPCIHPADASIHAIGMLHRGARSAIEFAGSRRFPDGRGPGARSTEPRHRRSTPRTVGGSDRLGACPRLDPDVHVHDRRDPDSRNRVRAVRARRRRVGRGVRGVARESTARPTSPITATLAGQLGHRQLRVRTPRPFEDTNRVSIGASGAVLLEGSSLPGLAAVALLADEDATASADGQQYALARSITLAPSGRDQIAFFLAVGPERDGAESTARVLRRRGWRELLVVDARGAAGSRAEHRARARRSADQSQSAYSHTFMASAARSTTRSTIWCAAARRGTVTASRCAIGKR